MANRSSKGKRETNTRNSKFNGKSNSCSTRSSRRSSADPDQNENSRYATKGSNDPQWYATDPNLLRDAANIAFSYPSGRPIKLSENGWPYKYLASNLAVVELLPTLGRSVSPTSPLNVAAMSQYTFVRKNKAGDLPFDAPDLMCYTIAMADVYSYINFLMRAYGLANVYSQQNLTLPRAIVYANYIDYDDLIRNLSDFRYGINVLINKAASLAAPANLTILARRAFLYQNLYSEGSSIKDQLYMYVPAGFMKYNDGYDTGSGTRLTWKHYADTSATPKYYTVSQLLAFGDDLISGVINSANAQSMSAFILEAFGDNILKLVPLSTDYIVSPVFDIGVLEQFKNTTVVPPAMDNGGTIASAQVVQDETRGFLQSKLALNMTHNARSEFMLKLMNGSRVLSTSSDKTDASLVMESSRLMMHAGTDYQPATSGSIDSIDAYAGSEIALRGYFYSLGEDPVPLRFKFGYYMENVNGGQTVSLMQTLMARSAFKFAPFVNIINFADDSAVKGSSMQRFYDPDNFAVLTSTDMERIHEAALLNELNVPKVGRV